jgi:hypothetical protein
MRNSNPLSLLINPNESNIFLSSPKVSLAFASFSSSTLIGLNLQPCGSSPILFSGSLYKLAYAVIIGDFSIVVRIRILSARNVNTFVKN